MEKIANRIYEININKKDIVVFRNGGKARVYRRTAKRAGILSRHPNYHVSGCESMGIGFSASIVRRLTQRAADGFSVSPEPLNVIADNTGSPRRGVYRRR